MYCKNCGNQLPDHATFCGKCGANQHAQTPPPEAYLYPGTENWNEAQTQTPVTPRKKKKKSGLLIALLIVLIFVILLATATSVLFAYGYQPYFEECAWCGEKPTFAFEMVDGDTEYACLECSNTCQECADQATHYYPSKSGRPIFVCEDCYDEIMEEAER